MRLGAIADGLVERIGLLLGKVPTPVGEALLSMPVARSLQVAQRTGMQKPSKSAISHPPSLRPAGGSCLSS